MEIIVLDKENAEKHKEEIALLIQLAIKSSYPKMKDSKKYSEEKVSELSKYLEEKKAICFCAEESRKYVGFIWAHPIERINGYRIHIAQIAVREEYQNQGIATKLMDQVIQFAKEEAYSGLDLLVTATDKAAYSFYKKMGYAEERFLMNLVL